MKKEKINHGLIVIGGGAAGMMAAICAAREAADVAIIEHTDKIGKKILVTGNGRCNLTNTMQRPDCYRGHDREMAWQVLQTCPPEKTRSLFRALGLLTREKEGYVYPYSNQAASVLRVLKAELYRLHIPVYYRTNVTEIHASLDGFRCETEETQIHSQCLVLATGSRAAEKTGSDGSGYTLAKQLGHTILPVLPALVQLTAKESCFKKLAGIRTEGSVTLCLDGKKVAADAGEIQLTEYGISGIPVFQISRYASLGLYERKNVTVEIDFCPILTKQDLSDWLAKKNEAGLRIREIIGGMLNEKLAEVLTELISLPEKHLTQDEIQRLTEIIKHFPVTITGTKGFEQCQICMGGVPLSEIAPETMESRLVKHLYLAGELLDVDGICGGYNLQWAWSSGMLAGSSAAMEMRKEPL